MRPDRRINHIVRGGNRMLDHWDMLEEIDELAVGLTPWEVNFVADLLDRYPDGHEGVLSDAQRAKIRQIYEERV